MDYLTLDDVRESLRVCDNAGNNKRILARDDGEDGVRIFLPGLCITLLPNGVYTIEGDTDGA